MGSKQAAGHVVNSRNDFVSSSWRVVPRLRRFIPRVRDRATIRRDRVETKITPSNFTLEHRQDRGNKDACRPSPARLRRRKRTRESERCLELFTSHKASRASHGPLPTSTSTTLLFLSFPPSGRLATLRRAN